ncbi:HD domain-containing protein [Anaerohalosphaera lusitana]|nr:HD domain-containing protein [Anaerohalosphaera lusitana]
MSDYTPTRDDALALFQKYNESESLTKHALAVEAVMRYFADKYGEDEEKWGVIGLIHDLDYEKFPDQHCEKTEEILRENNWPEDYIRAVLSHGWQQCTDIKPEHKMEKVLFATDELTGLITSTALVRPSRSVMDMKAKSVKKKFKDKSFAAKIDRDIIKQGAELLDMELSELMTETIMGMRTAAEELDLAGQN